MTRPRDMLIDAARRSTPGIIALAVAWIGSFVAYTRLPEYVAIHWNAVGQPNGYAPRFVAAVVLPSLLLVCTPLLYWLLPRIDPRAEEQARHARTWWLLANVTMVLLAGLQLIGLAAALGWVQPAAALPYALGGFFLVTGNYLSRLRPNWFMGIRTPWTLSSETVWRRTHRLGGALWMICGLVLLIAGAAGEGWLALPVTLLAVTIPVVYSYLNWRNETARHVDRAGDGTAAAHE